MNDRSRPQAAPEVPTPIRTSANRTTWLRPSTWLRITRIERRVTNLEHRIARLEERLDRAEVNR